jgi:hypothetical protein
MIYKFNSQEITEFFLVNSSICALNSLLSVSIVKDASAFKEPATLEAESRVFKSWS